MISPSIVRSNREAEFNLPESLAASLIEAAHDKSRVSGLTHNFYRYPARFSPKFVRAVIESFSKPGDVVLDPFMGGGTTIVEALALGRNGIGTDISSLAVFVAEVKTTLFDDDELDILERWRRGIGARVNIHHRSVRFRNYADAGYYAHSAFWSSLGSRRS